MLTESVRCRCVLVFLGCLRERPGRARSRDRAVLVALALLARPGLVGAQNRIPQGPAFPGAERFAVGATATGVPGALPWGIAQVRINAPVSERVGFDFDGGVVFGTKRIDTGQVPGGWAMDVYVRWLHGGRQPGGRAGYLLVGPRVVGAENIDASGKITNHRPIAVVDVGYGLDWQLKGRARAGAEFGSGAGKGLFVFVSGFVLIGPQ